MIIKPKTRGFICTTAHPAGCAANVAEQIDKVKAGGEIPAGPKRVLVIGASTGYGLASRITAAFGSGAATIGVFLEKPATEKKPGSAGIILPLLRLPLTKQDSMPRVLMVTLSPMRCATR
ncbi:MAG: hypothetical protein ABW100_18890 [Candidatus Thiodiazotropha sp. 6PLUC3]